MGTVIFFAYAHAREGKASKSASFARVAISLITLTHRQTMDFTRGASRNGGKIPVLRHFRATVRSAPPSCARVAPSSADVLPEAAGFLPAGVCLQEKVVEMLRRPEGATVDEVVRATAWQRHTVRGVFLVRQFEEILNIWPQFGFKGGLRQHG